MQADLEHNCRELLSELGLIRSGETFETYPLSGGVASDIVMVKLCDRTLCAKFALPKLKVEADWFAPVQRNAAEYAWLELVSAVAPQSAVELLGQSKKLHGFAMEYLQGDDVMLWKQTLLSQAADHGAASKVGELIGRVHAKSVQTDFDAQAFQNQDDFHALRIEPYLLYTASIHTDIADSLQAVASQLNCTRQVLIHGDVSPKNIFIRASGPIVLDAECATIGDASFDPSFCMNHLVLKAVHLPESRQRYLASVIQFWQAYHAFVSWESVEAIESRICRLLPMLMLARVDGKSPVEYLRDDDRNTVRAMARQLIQSPVKRLDEFVHRVSESLKGIPV